jgi:hypothetical protein
MFQVPLFEALEMRGCQFPVLQSDNGVCLDVPPVITISVLFSTCLGMMYMQQYDDIKSRNTFTIIRRFGSKSLTIFFVAISKWVMYILDPHPPIK